MDKNIIYYDNFFPSWVKAGITLRQFGDFKTGNFSETKSKQKLAQALKVSITDIITLHQFHQTTIHNIDENFINNNIEGDGLVTKMKGKVLVIKSADCLPILMVETQQKIIMALHAGRVGTQNNIAQQGLEKIIKLNAHPKFIKVIFGPSIERKCYTMDLVEENKNQLINFGVLKENILVNTDCTFCQNDKYFSYRRGDSERMGTFICIDSRFHGNDR